MLYIYMLQMLYVRASEQNIFLNVRRFIKKIIIISEEEDVAEEKVEVD